MTAMETVMQFLSFYKPAHRTDGPPSRELMAALGKLVEEQTKSGHLLATGGFLPPAVGLRVGMSDGAFTVRDGSGQTSDDLGGGFGLLQAATKEELIELVKQFLKVAGDGEC